MTRLKNIEEKILKLRTLDVDFSVFGSDSHKYILNSPLAKEELVQFEKNHNLTLPDEYREFLLNIENGGVGPFYGLLSLNYNEDQTSDPSQKFPLTQALNLDITKAWFKDYVESEGIVANEITEDQEDAYYELRDTKLNDLYETM